MDGQEQAPRGEGKSNAQSEGPSDEDSLGTPKKRQQEQPAMPPATQQQQQKQQQQTHLRQYTSHEQATFPGRPAFPSLVPIPTTQHQYQYHQQQHQQQQPGQQLQQPKPHKQLQPQPRQQLQQPKPHKKLQPQARQQLQQPKPHKQLQPQARQQLQQPKPHKQLQPQARRQLQQPKPHKKLQPQARQQLQQPKPHKQLQPQARRQLQQPKPHQQLQPHQQQQKQSKEAPTKSKSWRSKKKQQPQETEKGGNPPNFFLYFRQGKFDFKAINSLSPSEVQSILAKHSGGLKKMANSDSQEDERLQQICLLRALALACEAGKSESLTKILSAIKGSKFLCHQLPNILREIWQQQEEGSVDEGDTKQVITDMIGLYQTFLRCLPSAYSDLPLDEVQRYLKKISVQGKSEMEQKLDALKKERDEYIRDMRAKNAKPCKQPATNKKPPNDFRELQICPTVQELASDEKPFLRANVKKGSYEGVEHYLDVQFRLYREDFITPLRDGIKEIVKKIPRAERDQNIKTYDKVKITNKQYSRNGIIYTLHFDVSRFKTTRWESSRRLIFGSFLCLSKDNFANILFATVANRVPKELAKGFLDVSFVEGQNVHGIELRKADQYVMAESPAYFEAYRHVLAALQNLREGSLPFQKYLVECSKDVDAPAYLRDKEEPVRYDLSEALDVSHKETTDVAVLQPDQWPDVGQLPLNDSQYEALRTALTKEFSVIQGPPGTGKTYVGLKIARCLLSNSHAWNPTQDSPILMVCFTNHALDQFLEGILDFLPRGIIRVGSRCKSERLEKCNLKNEVYIARAQREENMDKLRTQQRRIESTKTAFEKLEKNDEMIELKSLDDSRCIAKEHLDNLFFSHLYDDECQSPQDVFESWLCNKSNTRAKVDYSQVTPEFKPDCQVPSRMQPEKDEVQNDEDQNLADDQGWGEADSYLRRISDTGEYSGISDASDETDDDDENPGVPSRNSMPRTLSDDKVQGDPGSQVETVQTSDTDNLTDTNHASYQDVLGDSSATPHDYEETEDDDQGWTEVKRKDKSVNKPLTEPTAKDGNLESQGEAKQQTKAPDGLQSNAGCGGDGEEALETIDIQEELLHFEKSRYLVGDEDLFLPLTTETNSSEYTVHDTDKENLDTNAKNINQDEVSNLPETSDPSRFKALADQTLTTKLEKEKQVERNAEEAGAVNVLQSDQNKQKKKKKKNGRKNENMSNKATPKELWEARTRMKSLTKMKEEEIENIDDIWDLPHDERLRLYLTWIDLLREYYRQRIIQEEQAYDGLCKEIDNKRMVEEEEILKKAKVIGMTTTGAARYHSVLQRIKPRIVIIEEAAEVLEAHIITSLARDTEQVILIGDHKQLRPKPTMYNLAIKYNLEISLFERMVLNKMDCKMLSIQHRMRPEIAQLTKRIYEEQIDDHSTVTEFEDVRGMKTNLFFLDHHEEESFHGGLQSYSNKHEADMMVALCRYLLQQDYKPSQITILTMYTGQLLTLKDKMPRKDFDGVRVTVVDNFQGEENDIILLSLVRSNKNGSMGFLKESNRICVALSRARKGFYCIGNFGLLSTDRLWKEICEELKSKDALSETIQLACVNHGTVTSVRKPNDFVKVPSGGCGLLCDVRLPCGHRCQQKCHGSDPQHSRVRCQRACYTSCPEGKHRCQERCHHPEECKPCPVSVPKVFPGCGHEGMVACWLDPKTQICDHPENKTLACGHQTNVPCFLDPLKNLKKQYREITHEPQTPRTFGRLKDPNTNKNKEKVQRSLGKERISNNWKLYESTLNCEEKCRTLCRRGLHFCEMTCHYGKECAPCKEPFESEIPRCGHSVQATCGTDFEALTCREPCIRLLKCGHPCKERCKVDCSTYKCQVQCPYKCENDHPCPDTCHFGRPCGPCKEIIEKVLPNCNHTTSSECHVDASTIPCLMPCERSRSCGHPCNKKCNEPCNTTKCKKRLFKTLSCGQHQKFLSCHVDLSKHPCKKEVVKDLPCGHHAQMQCHVDPSQYICKEEVDKELPCHHHALMQCHAAPSRYLCKEQVDKELPCHHHAQMQCHVDPSQYLCKEEVTKELLCGHHAQMQCHADPSRYPCKEQVDKELLCHHKIKMPCNMDTSQYLCKEEVTKELLCGHHAQMQCHADPSQYPCKEQVDKELLCHHKIKMPCNMDTSQYLCKEEVTKQLPCGHETQMQCNKDPSKHVCKVKVDKELPCRHQTQMPCNMDPSQHLCKEEVSKQLTCGHEIHMPCCINPSKGKCTTFVERKLPCGHMTRVLCGTDITKHSCKELILKMLSCGHEIIVPCDKDLSNYTCKEPVSRKLECGHEIQMACHADPSMHPCNITEDIKLPCGHIQKTPCHLSKTAQPICSEQVTKTLDCGHEQEMQCHLNPSHHICTEQAERTLACGHKKQMPCNRDIAQVTCTEHVIRKLPCGHDNRILCNSSPNDFQCKVPVMRELTCGHIKEMLCSTIADTTTIICDEMVEKELPCQHTAKAKCFIEPKDIVCEVLVERELPCKHIKKLPCHETSTNHKCQEVVLLTLPCNHVKQMACHENSEYSTGQCNTVVTKILACGHKIDAPCNMEVNTISCEKCTDLPWEHVVETREDNTNRITDEKITEKQPSSDDQIPSNADMATILADKQTKIDDFLQLAAMSVPEGEEVESPHGSDASEISRKDGIKKQTSINNQVRVPRNADGATTSQHTTSKDFHQIPAKTFSSEDDAKAPHGGEASNISSEDYTNEQSSIEEGEITNKKDALPLSPDNHTTANDLIRNQTLATPLNAEVSQDKHTKQFQTSQTPGKSHKVDENVHHGKQVMKQLPCGHEYLMHCNDDVSNTVCFRRMKKELPCGHVTGVSCNDDASKILCVVPTRKRLQCGHMKVLACNTDITSVACKTPVVKKLPCGHETKLPCDVDANTILCVEPTKKILQCGHVEEVPCNTDLTKESCNTLVVKTLPCDHDIELPCNADVNTILCVEPTKKMLQCGHMKELPCNTDMTKVSCNTLVVKTLPCDHDIELPCNADVNTILCVEPTKKMLQCGHMKELPCNTDMTKVSCNTLVVKKLPCDHDIELPCHKIQEDQICQRPCERLLPCNHKCKQKCSEKCDPKHCTEVTSKKVPCPNKHKITILCNVKVEAHYICKEKVTKFLTCGHQWKGECCKSNLPFRCEIVESRVLPCPGKHQVNLPCYVDIREIPCDKKCPKTLPCGHPCPSYCDEPCSPRRCQERVPKIFKECGHKKWLPCGIFRTAICLYDCLRPLKGCGHPCQGRCGKPCNSKPCLYEVLKTLPCGHELKMKCCDPVEYVRCPFTCTVKLDCGHICTGNCSTCQEEGEHKPCPLPCGRTLWCSHRCHQYCLETCRPCFRECRGWCPHGRCQRRCYEACEPCTMPCANTCPHSKCDNLCHEMCEREPCNQPCYKMLSCGHPCIGMCGESCPTLCYVCTPAKVAAASPNKQRNKELRFIQIQECGHVIEVKRMDAWMQEPVDTAANGQAQPRRCPVCSVPIYFSFRYGNTVREALEMMFESESFKTALEVWKAQTLYRLGNPHSALQHNRKSGYQRRRR